MRRFTALVALVTAVAVGLYAWNAFSTDDRPEPRRPGGSAAGSERATDERPADGAPERLERSSCPAEQVNCVVASGRVIYVEAVDPDGDGDAHFVTASRQGVTLPGITIFDVGADLRPDPLPGVGDLVGGSGPVFPGSQGQKQIEVVEFHVAR